MEIVIVGTAHVSKKSIEEVKRTIEEVKPDAVAVELCYRRFLALTKRACNISVVDVIRKGDVTLVLFQMLLSYFQKKVGKEVGIRPGEEMLAAIEKANELGADVLLIDRDIAITFKRFWSSLSFFEKIKILFHIINGIFGGEDVEVDEILKEDVLERLVKEFRSVAPSAAKVLIDERDAYMATKLIEASKRYERIVAVVGAGHKKGIERYLKNPESIPNPNDLEKVKERKFGILKVLSFVIFGFVILTFLAVLSTMNSETILNAFFYWFIINGVLSAAGALIAGAHPLSALAAFLTAWLTSLNPMIAAGWISGFVEVKLRTPTAEDFEKLVDAESLGDLLGNRVFRVLLVAALTNVGSMIGTIYGAWMIARLTGVNVPEVVGRNLLRILHNLPL